MDAEANGNVSSKGQNQVNLGDEFVADMLEMTKKPADSIVPATPDLKQETGEYALDLKSPISCPPKAICFGSQEGDIISANADDSPRTPKGSVFDPFAPGPDRLLLAPLLPKYAADSRISVARILNFDECSDHDDAVSDDEEIMARLCRMLLRIVVNKRTEEILAGIPKFSIPDSDCDGEKTPTSPPLLTGIAETCPAAPKKTGRTLVSIDRGLCKKLEF